MKRSLEENFIKDLVDGKLKNLLEIIKKDSTLDLQFRGKSIDVYYRGGKVLNLTSNANGYTAKIDKNYFKGEEITFDPKDIQAWIDKLPFIKQARDFHYSDEKNTAEREFQQLIIRSNNYERTSNSSDIFITDMEYDFKVDSADKKKGQIDLLGLEWHTNQRSKNGLSTKFAFIEVKFGNNAVSGKSGLTDHLDDVKEYLTRYAQEYLELVKDTLEVFKQKRDLGLYRFGANGNNNELDISKVDIKPYFIVVLADYKNKDNNLYKLIEQIDIEKYEEFFDLRFSISSFMGYGLYSDCLLNQSEILKHIENISNAKN